MERFTYCHPVVYPGIGRQVLISSMGAIGILALIVAVGLRDERSIFIPGMIISILFLIPFPLYFFYVFRSTKKLGSGRYPLNTNFYYHDELGIYFTRHLDQGKIARFVPWNHVDVINCSSSLKFICIVPDAEFQVTKKSCKGGKIECVMLSIKTADIKELIFAIYKHGIPVMSGDRMVYRSDLIKIHTP